MAEAVHEPVLVDEVVRFLGRAAVVVDMTVGLGGHAAALLEAGAGKVIGIDRDPQALAVARERLGRYGSRFEALEGRFSDAGHLLGGAGVRTADGVLYDLGVSSLQLESAGRGFSYRADAPLDMRMGDAEMTAADVVNGYPEADLARILREHGQERFAGRIARAIVRARDRAPLRTTRELGAVVAAAVPRRRGGPHPARRTFQAIRIEVNRELEELTASLPRAVQLLGPGGHLVTIAYHSLEDRIVKRFVREEERLESLTRKPVFPGEEEVRTNPRARSARLRAAERKAS